MSETAAPVTAAAPAEAAAATTETPKIQISDKIRAAMLGMKPKESGEAKAAEAAQSDPKPAEQSKVEKKAAPATEKAAAKDDPAPADPPKPKRKPPTKPPAAAAQDPADLANLVREGVVAGVREITTAKKPEDPKLPTHIERRLPALKRLKDISGDKYDGIIDQVTDFYRKGGKEDQYREQWLKDNPGKKYNGEDADHEAFYADHEPFVDEDDLDAAKELVMEDRLREKLRREIEPVREEAATREATTKTEAVIPAVLDQIAMDALKRLDPAYEKYAGAETNLAEEEPIAAEALMSSVAKHRPVIEAAIKLFQGAERYNEKNPSPAHAAVLNHAVALEEALADMDPDQSVKPITKGGNVVGYLSFAKREDFMKMPKSAQAKHWSVGLEDVLQFLAGKVGSDAVAERDRLDNLYRKASGRNGSQVQKNGHDNPAGEPKKAEKPTAKDASVSVSGTAEAPPPRITDGGQPEKAGGLFAERAGWVKAGSRA